MLSLWARVNGDHYTTLGLDRSATVSEVRRQYRIAALRYHPDRCVHATAAERAAAEARFKAAAAAYETLRCAQRRAEYDASLPSGWLGQRAREEDEPSDAAPAPSVAATIVVRCTLRELFDGACKLRRVPGLINLNVILRPEWADRHSFEVLSPDGRFVRVVIRVRPHADLARRGCHLFCERFVTRAAAVRGVPVRVRSIDGLARSFRPLRGGSWRDGERLDWPGAGMWAADGSRGDLIVRVRVAPWPTVVLARAIRAGRSRAFARLLQALGVVAYIESARTVAVSAARLLYGMLSRRSDGRPGLRWRPKRARWAAWRRARARFAREDRGGSIDWRDWRS